MIIPDINLLVYAYNRESPFHERARQWWASCLSGSEQIGMPWAVSLGFVRLWTNPRSFGHPMTIDVASSHVESWLERRNVEIIHPGPHHARIVFRLLRAEGKGGNLTTDAHIAALAIENKAVVHTSDTDFLRFTGVEWKNPLL